MQRPATSPMPRCGASSLLTPIGYQCGDCGYCKAEDSSQRTPDSRASYYARSKSICPSLYQILMDHGWRRSGALFYLPDAARSCCPHYTIRIPAAEFHPSRDQRQSLHRWNRFVVGDQYLKEASIKHPTSKRDKKQSHNAFDLTSTVHQCEKARLRPDIQSEHSFEVTLEADEFTEEKFLLFDNYQRHVHHEGDGDISRTGFKRFLCSSPLHRHAEAGGKALGSFHQCYRLDGRLIAMGVLDLLPHAVSGVYFLYHSDFERWSFGKLSALREATLALEGGYDYYYMGYYIHGCKKMRYKGDYHPQYVLDLHSFQWDPLDDAMRALMERRKYASMSRERARQAVTLSSKESTPDVHDRKTALPDHLLPNPIDATNASMSLLQLTMPGVLSREELQDSVVLEDMHVSLGRGGVHCMSDIVSWNQGSVDDTSSIQGIVAEMAAAIGPEVARKVILDFSP